MADLYVGSGSPKVYLGDRRVMTKNDYSLANGFTTMSQYAYSTGASFDWRSPYEIQLCLIKLANSLNSNGVAFAPWGSHYGTPKINVSDSIIGFTPNGGTSSDIDPIYKVFDSPPCTKNEPIWIKATYDGGAVGTGKITLSISYDGEIFEEIASKVITTAMRSTSDVPAFGSSKNTSTYTVFPYMNFVWDECYIKLNGTDVWGRSE